MFGYRGMPIALFTSIKQSVAFKESGWFYYSEEKEEEDVNLPSLYPVGFLIYFDLGLIWTETMRQVVFYIYIYFEIFFQPMNRQKPVKTVCCLCSQSLI